MRPTSWKTHAAWVVVATQFAFAGASYAAEGIGEAAAIDDNVEAALAGSVTVINSGDLLYQNQIVTTDNTGTAQIEFRDGTLLAVGPSATITLDEFVYDSSGTATKVAIGVARGSLRFLTGRSSSDVYEIATTSATIGVRGTFFDLYASDDGQLALAMIDGEVIVCSKSGECRAHGTVGGFLYVTSEGAVFLRDAWDGSFLAGIPFSHAFPFLADQSPLIEGLRASIDIVGGYVIGATEVIIDAGIAAGQAVEETGEAAGAVIEDVVKSIISPKAKPPKLRLPKLFK
ncbi:MAG: FecR family protein [Alphaproteobacteria bacterium]